MRDAVEALAKRKFGEGGVYNPNTPGAWSDSPKVRESATPYTEEFKDCVALQAQYIYDTYGKFPGTIQSIFCFMYVQAQHLDLDFYNHYFNPGAYPQRTHEKVASDVKIISGVVEAQPVGVSRGVKLDLSLSYKFELN